MTSRRALLPDSRPRWRHNLSNASQVSISAFLGFFSNGCFDLWRGCNAFGTLIPKQLHAARHWWQDHSKWPLFVEVACWCYTASHSADAAAVLKVDSDAERKVELTIACGLRIEGPAAEAFVASILLQHLTLSDHRQRVEALRMFDRPLASIATSAFQLRVLTMIPRFVYVAAHAYDP